MNLALRLLDKMYYSVYAILNFLLQLENIMMTLKHGPIYEDLQFITIIIIFSYKIQYETFDC